MENEGIKITTANADLALGIASTILRVLRSSFHNHSAKYTPSLSPST